MQTLIKRREGRATQGILGPVPKGRVLFELRQLRQLASVRPEPEHLHHHHTGHQGDRRKTKSADE
jgi:hypothetical protein